MSVEYLIEQKFIIEQLSETVAFFRYCSKQYFPLLHLHTDALSPILFDTWLLGSAVAFVKSP